MGDVTDKPRARGGGGSRTLQGAEGVSGVKGVAS